METTENEYSFNIDENESELKQHLNLSENAWLVIKEDIKNFYDSEEKESFSGFLNRIFKNFYQKADASINLRHMQKAGELEKLYSSKEFSKSDKKSIKQFIDKYMEVYENELIDKSKSYPKGSGEKFRINKESLRILGDLLQQEAKYYEGSIGLYLKAIYEEYVTKPRYIREQIFFADSLSEIQKAIGSQRKIKIALLPRIGNDEKTICTYKFYVSPYKIVQDKTNSYNYLIGYGEGFIEKEVIDEAGNKVKATEELEKSPACWRLSTIEKADVMLSMGAHISLEKAKELEKMLIQRTAMFMTSEPVDIKIVFTDKGLESFRRQLYMRPQFYEIDPKDKYVYTFHCAEFQAMNYFFKFGWDANIIEPQSLREAFMQKYERALKSYQGLDKEKIFEGEKNS